LANVLLTHLPHIGLGLLVAVFIIWMERADRKARLAGVDGEVSEEDVGGPSFATVVGSVITVSFSMSVVGLAALSSLSDPPGVSLVATYLLAGAAAAVWAGWSTQQRLPTAVRGRIGRPGQWMVGGVITLVLVWGVVFGGLLMSQGVLLPAAG